MKSSLVRCASCGMLTTRQEARLRLFRTGRCGFCGGRLVLKESNGRRRLGLRSDPKR